MVNVVWVLLAQGFPNHVLMITNHNFKLLITLNQEKFQVLFKKLFWKFKIIIKVSKEHKLKCA